MIKIVMQELLEGECDGKEKGTTPLRFIPVWITYEDPSIIVELLRIQVIPSYLFERAPFRRSSFQ